MLLTNMFYETSEKPYAFKHQDYDQKQDFTTQSPIYLLYLIMES